MPSDPDPRTSEYNQQGDVWRHTYARPPVEYRQAQRSRERYDMQDRLIFRAQAIEAGDRVTAQLLREASARIDALELLLEHPSRPAEGGA
jgi:hypothetical protein